MAKRRLWGREATVQAAQNPLAQDEPVLVIGLGRFGVAAAVALQNLGHEVLAVDNDPNLVQQWSSRFQTVEADATIPDSLEQIGVADFRVAVVAVGTSIEASVLITANLTDHDVTEIWAKAISVEHRKILKRIGADHVILPEVEVGQRVAHLVSGRFMDYIELGDNFTVVKLRAPAIAIGQPLNQIKVLTDLNVKVVGVKAPGAQFSYADEDTVLNAGDTIIVGGATADIAKLSARV